MNKLQAAEQLRRALQMFAATLSEDCALEVASVFDSWRPGVSYKGGDYFTYGTNAVGDPQLYKVNIGKDHVSQESWTPDIEKSLYTAIGLDQNGYAVWSQPSGAHDAYNKDDVVNYNGTLYVSLINGNTYVPGTDERWWMEKV